MRLRNPSAPLADLLATLVDLAAWSIADCLRQAAAPPGVPLYLCGGGAENLALRQALSRHLGSGAQIRLYAELAPAGDLRGDGGLREAVAFALLGDAFLRREPATWPSTTGCRRPALLGLLCPASNAASRPAPGRTSIP